MKITLTGSIGNINKHLIPELMKKGHEVKIISSKPEKQKEIEALGAKAAIGKIEDLDFLTSGFEGADIVYCMEAPGNFMDPHFDLFSAIAKLGNNFAGAIRKTGVRRVVHLSSIGAHR